MKAVLNASTNDAPDAGEVRRLLAAADKGDAKAMARLRELAKTTFPNLWDAFGDLAETAEHHLVKMAVGEAAFQAEAVKKKLETMRREIAGPNPSPLERLLVERIVLCWVQVQYQDARAGMMLQQPSYSISSLEHRTREAERAERRYIQAIKALATVRRLALPTLQVNLAQVNIGAGTAEGPETVEAAAALPENANGERMETPAGAEGQRMASTAGRRKRKS